MSNIKIAAAVLSGGQSRRMKRDKATLSLNNITLKQHQHNQLSSKLISKIYHCDNKTTKDRFIDCGPLAGIDALFQQGDFSDFDFCICLPVDMPNMQTQTIEELIKYSIANNQSVAFEHSILPLVFPINSNVKNWLENQLSFESNWSIKAFSQFLNTHFLKTDSKNLLNINTPTQWQEYLNHERS